MSNIQCKTNKHFANTENRWFSSIIPAAVSRLISTKIPISQIRYKYNQLIVFINYRLFLASVIKYELTHLALFR